MATERYGCISLSEFFGGRHARLMAHSSIFKRVHQALALYIDWSLLRMRAWAWDYQISTLYVEIFEGTLDEAHTIIQGDRIQPKIEEPAIEPIVTRLSVFTTKDTSTFDDFFLPEFSSEGESCVTCEFWRITNPGMDVRCEDCRLPEVIEPSMLLADGCKGKERMPSVDFTHGTKGKELMPKVPAYTRCSACELSALVNPAGPSCCSSCLPQTGLLSPVSPPSAGCKVRRSRAGRNSKLPLSALNRLQGWLDAHQDNPYPSADLKRQLAQECGITEKQVTTWFTNARARQLNPLDTYLSSGSEEEFPQESDIASAAQTPAYSTGFTYLSEQNPPSGYRRAGSVSGSSAFSASNSRPQPSRRGKKKNYRRNNLSPQITEQPSFQTLDASHDTNGFDQEMWQCTFCRRHLVPKSWRRHEETQHRPRAQWTCMLFGPRLSFPQRSDSTSSASYCAFCMAKDPCEDHFLTHHRISECAKRPIGERTFFRPDHLRQHVKNFHGSTLFDIAQTRWKKGANTEEGKDDEGWTCGFCGIGLESWGVRETHIAGHFKEGMTMATWRDYPSKSQIKMEKQIEKEPEKEKEKKHGKEKADKEEKRESGLARLSRTFTRRSTRSSKASSSQQQPQTQLQHQPPTTFAHSFNPIPHTAPPMTMAHDFSAPPVLPDINLDPLMGGYTNFADWSQVVDPQYADNLVYDPSLDTSYDAALHDVLEFGGNPVDYHGTWHPQS